MKKEIYSKPHYSKELQIHTLQAQRILDRIFKRLVTHLYSIEAILPFTDEAYHAKALDRKLSYILDKHVNIIFEEKQTFAASVVDLKIDIVVVYSHIKTFEAKITSPSMTKLVAYIDYLDIAVRQIDLLWLTKEITIQKRTTYLKSFETQALLMMQEIEELVNSPNTAEDPYF